MIFLAEIHFLVIVVCGDVSKKGNASGQIFLWK